MSNNKQCPMSIYVTMSDVHLRYNVQCPSTLQCPMSIQVSMSDVHSRYNVRCPSTLQCPMSIHVTMSNVHSRYNVGLGKLDGTNRTKSELLPNCVFPKKEFAVISKNWTASKEKKREIRFFGGKYLARHWPSFSKLFVEQKIRFSLRNNYNFFRFLQDWDRSVSLTFST